MNDRPKAYAFWPQYAKDVYDERIAIGREAANVPDDMETPLGIRQVAFNQAVAELKSFEDSQKNEA